MEALVDEGLVKYIGVSNFSVAQVRATRSSVGFRVYTLNLSFTPKFRSAFCVVWQYHPG